jgi:hypothetical protein
MFGDRLPHRRLGTAREEEHEEVGAHRFGGSRARRRETEWIFPHEGF